MSGGGGGIIIIKSAKAMASLNVVNENLNPSEQSDLAVLLAKDDGDWDCHDLSDALHLVKKAHRRCS